MGHWEPQGRAGGAGRATKGFALVLIVAQLAGIQGALQAHQQGDEGARAAGGVAAPAGVMKGRPAWRAGDDEPAEALKGGRFFALREKAKESGQGKQRSLQDSTPAPVSDGDGTSSPTEGQDEERGTSTSQDTPAPVEDTNATPSPVDQQDDGTTPAPTAEEGGTPAPSSDESYTSINSDTTATPSPTDEGEPPVGGSPAPTEVVGTGAPFECGLPEPCHENSRLLQLASTPSQCSNGIPGVSDGTVCCKEACGQCGGEGCGAVVGTNGASDCCPSTIIQEAAGEVCGEAPCVMEGFTPSPVNPAFDGTVAPFDASTCANGVPGYQDGDICCQESCGQCGGAGCGTIPGTGGAANCCPTTIRESGVVCGEAPCIIEGYTPAPAVVGGGTAAPIGSSTCSNGVLGFQDGAACCAANCGQCGGDGCGAIPGTAGSEACCSSIVLTQGESCDVTNESPCVIEGYTPSPVVPDIGSAAPVVPSQCSNGMPGYQDLDVCCLEACGQCGGAGCGTVPGTGGSAFCCSTSVRESGQMCGNGVEPPCIIGGFTPSPVNPAFSGTASPVPQSTCSNGLPGVQNGAACCKESCGQCGGVGCGTIPGTGGSSSCCASTVLLDQNFCGNGNGNVAPCVIQNYTPAPAGVPGVAAPFAASTCTNGFAGVQDDNICCDESCGQCGGPGCGAIPGTAGPDSCCSTTIAANGTACQITGAAPCIITDWVNTPAPFLLGSAAPVVPSTCNNGLAGIQANNICCKMSCGLCGGNGCSQVPGTAGASDCCPTTIFDAGVECGGQVVAPCIVPFTPAPTMAPATTPVPTPTPFLSGNANDFVNNTANAAESRLQAPVGMVPFVASLAAFLGALAFTAHHSGREATV